MRTHLMQWLVSVYEKTDQTEQVVQTMYILLPKTHEQEKTIDKFVQSSEKTLAESVLGTYRAACERAESSRLLLKQ